MTPQELLKKSEENMQKNGMLKKENEHANKTIKKVKESGQLEKAKEFASDTIRKIEKRENNN